MVYSFPENIPPISNSLSMSDFLYHMTYSHLMLYKEMTLIDLRLLLSISY